MLTRHFLRAGARLPRSLTPIVRTYAAANPQSKPSPPSPEELKTAAAGGVRLTPEKVAEISRREQAHNPTGQRVHGGPSSTAQTILAKQQQLDAKLDELSEKLPNEITEKDVGQLQSAMTKGRGGQPVEKDNIVSDLHRVAQANEGMRHGPVPVKGVDKEDAAELQSEEARISGHGRNEKGGLAAQAQSIADKENA